MYATAEDFILRVGELQTLQLTDRENIGEINRTLLDITLADSSSQIDGYLGSRYTPPITPVPQNLTRICCDLTRYRLCSMSDVAITDEIITRYKLSLQELEDLSAGKISLGIEPDKTADDGDFAVMFSNGNNRIFARDK